MNCRLLWKITTRQWVFRGQIYVMTAGRWSHGKQEFTRVRQIKLAEKTVWINSIKIGRDKTLGAVRSTLNCEFITIAGRFSACCEYSIKSSEWPSLIEVFFMNTKRSLALLGQRKTSDGWITEILFMSASFLMSTHRPRRPRRCRSLTEGTSGIQPRRKV